MNENITEKMGDIENSIDALRMVIQNGFSGSTNNMGVVEGGFARSHDRLDRIADALESIVYELSRLNDRV